LASKIFSWKGRFRDPPQAVKHGRVAYSTISQQCRLTVAGGLGRERLNRKNLLQCAGCCLQNSCLRSPCWHKPAVNGFVLADFAQAGLM
jgi:hypothetical protein